MTAPVLRLAADLTLPLEAVTETIAILAKRGSGKTYTAAVFTEELILAGLPALVIDPLGAWYGLRSSADGRGDGLPVVIFGGEHADLPLHEHTGARIADVLVQHRVPAVLDLSELPSVTAQRRLVADLLDRVYHRNREPLHLVLDEADLWAPQHGHYATTADRQVGARCLAAVQNVQRRGRLRGLGTTIISQRSQSLHKDVLGQAEVLIVLQMTGVRDVRAVDEWVRLHAEDTDAERVKDSLAGLPVGTAWLWSPGWLQLLRQVAIRRRHTFDSSATPRPGVARVVAERMATVDLAALAALLQDDRDGSDPASGDPASGDPADDDPVALRRRMAVLQRRLAELQAAPPREVPVLTADDRAAVDALADRVDAVAGDVHALRTAILARLDPTAPTAPTLDRPTGQAIAPSPPRAAPVPPRTQAPAAATTTSTARDGATAPLRAGARRLLIAAARNHPRPLTRAQLATLAGLAVTGGTFTTYCSTLRTRGLLVEHDGRMTVTPTGLAAAGVAPDQPLTLEEVRDQWRSLLRAGARTMLDLLIDAHPDGLTREALAAAARIALTGGTFGTYLAVLRRNGLATVHGNLVRAADALFLADHPDPAPAESQP